MNNDAIAYFISFCIEQYKNHTSMSGVDVIQLFDKYEITEYLAENYELLYTQNHHWLIEEIDELVATRKNLQHENISRKQ